MKESNRSLFLIPESRVLNRMNFWITTDTNFNVNFYETKNSLSFVGDVVFEIDLSKDYLSIDLVKSSFFSFVLFSRGSVIFGENAGNILLISDFDKIGIIQDLKLNRTIMSKIEKIPPINDCQIFMSVFKEVVGDKKLTIVSRKNFYFFHEVCFLPSRVSNIEKYLNFIFDKMVDFSDEDIWKSKTILYELFDNAVEHGSKFDESKMIKIETMINNNGLSIMLSDQGEGFDISKLDLNFDKEKTTGRGIAMVKKLSDIFSVQDRGRTTYVFVSRSNSQYIPFIY